MRILHITAHLGGGAGKAVAGLALLTANDNPGDLSRVLLLEKPEKTGYADILQANGIEIVAEPDSQTLAQQLAWADAVVVSWWNHPAMAAFLASFPPVPVRFLLWSHVNGLVYPHLPTALAREADMVFVTAPCSLENPDWTEDIKEKTRVIYGMGDFAPEKMPEKKDYQTSGRFLIGYAGTLGYAKIHPDFVELCRMVKEEVSNAQFVLLGDLDEELKRDIETAGLAPYFTLTGFVPDVAARLPGFDIFAYPLNSSHYGTTENALLEAMACALPVLALDGPVERALVAHGETGLLAKNHREYAAFAGRLAADSRERARLGRQARRRVIETYDAHKNAANLRRAAGGKKRVHSFPMLGKTPWDWFLFCTGQERGRFEKALAFAADGRREEAEKLLLSCPPVFRMRTKSSAPHFLAVYPQDKRLQIICSILGGKKNGGNKAEL